MNTKFALGDGVAWGSQAGSYYRWKEGVIVAVVPAGSLPGDVMPVSRKIAQTVMPRNHESYVVRVRGRGLFWPRVSQLKPEDVAGGPHP
jgi:hypothetical protein